MTPSAERVAALYDIHGNLPALEAVLSEVAVLDVDVLVVGGDVVPGPMPVDCLAVLEDAGLPVLWIHGNGEADTVRTARGGPPDRVPQAFHGVMRWVAGRLDEERLERMAAWPRTVQVEVVGCGRVTFCHATPRDENEIFTVNTPESRVEELLRGADADVVVCGHTHMPFDRNVGGLRVVNAGSVGMPFGDTCAQWLLLDAERVQARRTEYDLEAAQVAIRATGYPLPPDLEHPPSAEAMLGAFEAAAETAAGGSARRDDT